MILKNLSFIKGDVMFKQKEIEEILSKTSYRLVGKWKGTAVKNTFKSVICNHKFEMLWRNLQRKIKNGEQTCKECSIKEVKLRNSVEDISEFISKNTQKEYKLISKNYENNRSNLLILHKSCGKTYEGNFTNFQSGKRCPHCSRKSQESKAAQLFKRVLTHLNVEYEEEKKFKDCCNPFTSVPLRFDLYLVKEDILIEIDGEQHDIPVSRFGGEKGLREVQYRDYLKNKFCFEENKTLIRFSLYDAKLNKKKSFEEIKLEIFHFLNKRNLYEILSIEILSRNVSSKRV